MEFWIDNDFDQPNWIELNSLSTASKCLSESSLLSPSALNWMHEFADKSTDLNAWMSDSVISVRFQSWLI
jgi:hypothetical protein